MIRKFIKYVWTKCRYVFRPKFEITMDASWFKVGDVLDSHTSFGSIKVYSCLGANGRGYFNYKVFAL